MTTVGNRVQKTLIVIAGPTASGKTSLAIETALSLGTEILSFDSRQFYQEMRIGTAVPTPSQLAAVPHHFIQHISVNDPYDVASFAADALILLESLFKVHDQVIAVGGSGLYIHALMYGLDKLPGRNEEIRIMLMKRIQNEGLAALSQELHQLDPVYHSQVDLKNPSRIIRALEVCYVSGKPYSHFRHQEPERRSFQISAWAIDVERSRLHASINERVDEMIETGLVEEAETLYSYKHHNALQTLGYQELFSYLDGDISLEQAILNIKTNTRRYARRQITWFRRDVNFEWLSLDRLRARLLH